VSEDVLRVEHVSKRFGPVTALRDVNLHLRKCEVLGLLGDNGAGKSTLIKIISGFQKPDAGKLFIKDDETELRSVDHARSLGIDCVYQDLALVNQLDVVQNMFLRREQLHSPFPFLARKQMRVQTRSTRSGSTCRASACPLRGSPAASARRSRSPAPSTPTRTSSCSTNPSPPWAPKKPP
jgi:ABC-type sugar transport system ATPase subunit